MWRLLALRLVLNLWLVISFSSGQSGDDVLADLGSGYILDTPQDQPKVPQYSRQDTNKCQLTFVTQQQESCMGKDNSWNMKEEVKYLQNLLQDNNRVLQSLRYTVNADAQDLGYQQVISEHNKGIREDNKEFYGTLNKIIHELHTRMDDEGAEVIDEKKKVKKNFLMMNHLLQTTFHLADKLDKTSEDLDILLGKQLERSTALAYRNILKS
ncbi:hypothetical protein GDO78_016368 [Eleutherodactylus coqui]|uniref:Uncharacterized protein n=1 Tax=Eleutherodactylus coqui TaxID=57060 RepID=A0A8J6EKX4_ELECQ|nr:hypothetical protein GDO78_016368 [Eleutherodactylus coqui]